MIPIFNGFGGGSVDIKDLRYSSIVFLLATAIVSSVIFVAMPAYSGGGISHPHENIIEVAPGENFLLRYRLYWNEPGYDGMYYINLVWYNYENKPEENLTFLSARAYFDNGDNITTDVTLESSPSGANTMWILILDSSWYPSPYDDNFTVDIWMRAAGAGNVPHAPRDNHPILSPGGLPAVSIAESTIKDIPGTEKPITIRVPSVPVLISPFRRDGFPGENLQYTVTITNMGKNVDNYTLENKDNLGWVLTLSKYRLEDIENGRSENVTLTVTVPDNADYCTEDNIIVTAISEENENVKDNDSCIAHALRRRGAIVSISPENQENWAGVTLDYTVTVRNIGMTNDNYKLENTDNSGWTLGLDNIRFENVPPDGIRTTILHVTIPDNATHCTKDKIIVTAISEENENVRDNDSCIAHALTLRVEVSISPSENKRVPGEKPAYTVTVKNTGIKPDNYDLKVTDNAGWGLALDNYELENIENGKSENVKLTVTIPEGTSYRTRDEITVTATSRTDNTVSDNASCIAQSAAVSLEISITPGENRRVPGKTATFTVNVKNTSYEDPLFEDNYLLTVKDRENWGLNFGPRENFLILSGILTGEKGVATLYVTIPENATYGTADNVTVTAKSTKYQDIWENASCIARSATVKLAVSITPNENIRIHGENATFTVSVTNKTDDYSELFYDNYILTVRDNLGWQLWVDNIQNVPGPHWSELNKRWENRSGDAKLIVTIDNKAPYGTADNITVTARSMENESVRASATCVARSATVSLAVLVDYHPTPWGEPWGKTYGYQENLPGGTTTHNMLVKNTSTDPNFKDNYLLTVKDNLGWGLWLDRDRIENAKPGDEEVFTITVTIPENATNCTKDIVTVTARSMENENVRASATCTAHALTFRVGVSISPSENKKIQGENAVFTVTVKNTGLKPDNYDLTIIDNAIPSWGPTLSNYRIENLGPLESKSENVYVTVPENASYGTRDMITVTVRSRTDNTVENSASCIAQSAAVSLEVTITPYENRRIHGKTAAFTVKVTNTSEDPRFMDNYTLENKDNLGWQLWLEDNYFENVGVGPANAKFTTLTVTIPENASYGTRDMITVTATSMENENVKASNICFARSATVSLMVKIKENYMACVPGENAVFTVTVKNTSDDDNFVDNYTLTVRDNLGWKWRLTIENIENVLAGKENTRTLYVTIPENENALEGRRDNIIVTARSQTDNTVSAESSCIARAGFVDLEVSISPGYQRAFPGGELEYDVWVKNTGTVVENLEFVELIDDRGWISRGVTPKTFLNVSPGENGRATFRVRVPPGTAHGKKNNITVKWKAYRAYAVFRKNVSPSDDAYVFEGGPDKLFGVIDSTVLGVAYFPGSNKMPWLKFDLLPPPGAEKLLSAKLWLYFENYENYTTEQAETGVYFSENDNWLENEITWSNMPSFAQTPIDKIYLGKAFRSWDVTLDVQREWLAGDNKISWCLKNVGTEGYYEGTAHSKEIKPLENSKTWLAGLDPFLEVMYENEKRGVKYATNTCTATATYLEISLFIAVPLPKLKEGRPGDNITFPVVITNTNMENAADNYTLTVIDDAGWSPRLDNYLFENVSMGDSRETMLRVTIPENASLGMMDNLKITATSGRDPTISTSDSCSVLVTAFIRRVGISITPSSQRNLPGSTLNYTVVVKNEGDVADSYVLTVGDNVGWSPSVSPSTLTSIAPGASRNAALTVVIPEGAENGATDGITVTATSKSDNSVRRSASCTAVASTVPPRRGVQVSISPEEQSGLPDEMLTYTVTVKNMGEVEDTYDLNVSDTKGWGAILSNDLLTIMAGENRTATLNAIVSSGAVKDESTMIRVVATSRVDPRVENSATCRAKAAEGPSKIPIPLIAGAAIGVGAVATVMLLLKRRAL